MYVASYVDRMQNMAVLHMISNLTAHGACCNALRVDSPSAGTSLLPRLLSSTLVVTLFIRTTCSIHFGLQNQT